MEEQKERLLPTFLIFQWKLYIMEEVPLYHYMKLNAPFGSKKRFPFISKMVYTIFINLAVSCTCLMASNCIIEVVAFTGNNSSTNTTMESAGDYTNNTTFIPRQIITEQSATSQVIPGIQPGQSMPETFGSNSFANTPNINITIEQATKAEQEANVMLKAYNEKVEQEKALETTKTNQTTIVTNISSMHSCLEGELAVKIGQNSVCLSPYEISIACNQGGSLFGDPVCGGSAGVSSIQQPGLGQTTPEEEVIDEKAGQSQQPGGGEEEVLEEGDAGEQEVIEDFE